MLTIGLIVVMSLSTGPGRYYNLKRECQRECRTAYNKYVSNLVDPKKNI